MVLLSVFDSVGLLPHSEDRKENGWNLEDLLVLPNLMAKFSGRPQGLGLPSGKIKKLPKAG